MYLVDTNVVSELRRRSPQAVAGFDSVESADVYLSVITISEIARGIAKKQGKDPEHAARLGTWLQGLHRHYAARTVPIDDAIAIEWRRISARRSRNNADSLIAATAVARNMTLVTRNVADFADLPVVLLDPWKTSTP